MKKLIIALALGSIAFASCKEKSPIINYFTGYKVYDTTYVLATVPAADAHNVLIEDFTGQTCGNCPTAKTIADNMAAANPGRINIIGLFVTDYSQTIPDNSARYDLRDSQATDIEHNIFGAIEGMPTGGIDRQPVGSDPGSPCYIDYNSWNSVANTQLSVNDSINLSVVSTSDGTKATIKATITYLKPCNSAQNLSIVIVEDSLTDLQEEGFTTDTFYHFSDVFRGMVTTEPLGDPIEPSISSKEAGRVSEVTYVYPLNLSKNTGSKLATHIINPANCRVIAFVTWGNGSSTHVYQSAQCKINP